MTSRLARGAALAPLHGNPQIMLAGLTRSPGGGACRGEEL